MSELPNVQPPHQLLELLGRPYRKRDEILEASNRLVEYSYNLQNCRESELEGLQNKINKEMNKIISNVNELTPFLENPGIVSSIGEITTRLSLTLEHLRFDLDTKYSPALLIRDGLCPVANMTRLKLTPKSFKKAYGVEIGIKDMMTLKGFLEHQQNNY
jgi:hypothetical protein